MILAQWSVSEWTALIAVAATILGGLGHIVWRLSGMNSKLDMVGDTVKEQRKALKAHEDKTTTRFENHEVRLVRLESK